MLVDEYQDTNRLQASILLALKPDGRGLTVVGDDAQSIYSFRAATVRNILDFPASSRRRPRSSRSSSNYRSTQPILAAANAVIGLARRALHQEPLDRPRLRATGRSSSPCATRPTRRATSSSGCWRTAKAASALKQQAVLFRTSHHSGPLEVELTRRNIPFVKFGGLKFLEAAHVKDVLALLRFAENPRDRVAGFRVLQLLPGVGPASAQRVLDHMAESGRSARGARQLRPRRRAPARTGRRSSTPSLDLRSGRSGWPAELETRAALVRAASRAHPRGRADAPGRPDPARADRAGYPSRERFLTELTLDPPDATSDQAGVPLLRRGLPDPLDHPLRQGPGVEVGVRAQRRRRLHPVRSRRPAPRPRSRRSGGCSTSR